MNSPPTEPIIQVTSPAPSSEPNQFAVVPTATEAPPVNMAIRSEATPAPLPSRIQPRSPTVYKGTSLDARQIQNWVFNMRQYLTLSSATPEQEVICAASYLEDDASIWFQGWFPKALASAGATPTRKKIYVPWDQFVEALRAAFLPPDHHRSLRQRLANLRQTGTLAEYIVEFRSIRLSLDISEDEALDRFERGLRPYTQGQLALYAPDTVDQAIRMATKIDNAYQVVRQATSNRSTTQANNKYSPTTTRNTPTSTTLSVERKTSRGQDTPRLGRLTEAERERLRTAGGCFKCRQIGHFSGQCPKFSKSILSICSEEVDSSSLESEKE